MKLRKVDDFTWVNVGTGNVTSVTSYYYAFDADQPRTRINFVSGSQLEIKKPGAIVVRDMTSEGGFGQ